MAAKRFVALTVFLFVCWQGLPALCAPPFSRLRPASEPSPPLPPTAHIISTDEMAIRVPAGRLHCLPPRSGKDVPGPIMAIRGPDGVWRGDGWIEGPADVEVLDGGQEGDDYVVTYAFVGGGRAEIRFRLPPEGDHIHVVEECYGSSDTWVLSFAENFGADRVLAKPTAADEWTGLRRVRQTGHLRHGRLTFWSQFGGWLDYNDWMGVFGGRATRDFVGFLRIRSETWSRPSDGFLSLWERDGQLRLEGEWRSGHREWLLVVTSRDRGDAADARQRLLAIERQWVWTNRQTTTLEWDEPLVQYRPALTDGERRDKQTVLAELERLGKLLDERGYLAPPDTRPFVSVYLTYQRLRQLGLFLPDEDRRARRALASLAYNCMNKDVFPWDRATLPPGHAEGLNPPLRALSVANYNAERCAIVGDIAAILPRHPMARVWAEHFASQFRFLMDACVHPGGLWEEGVAGSADALLFLTLAARQARPGGPALLGDERLHSMWEFLLKTATPPLRDGGGQRLIAQAGEAVDQANMRDLFLLGATAYSAQDPRLAQRLLWLHEQMGGSASDDPGRAVNRLAADAWARGGDGVVVGLPADLTAATPTLESAHLPGFGAMLRASDPSGDETCLLFRCGPAWGRSRNDEGSIHLWAKGAALVADAGHGGQGQWQRLARGHSRVAFSNFEPANLLDGATLRDPRVGLPDIRSFATLPGADYVCGVVPTVGRLWPDPDALYSHQPAIHWASKPLVWRRHILFVKPDYFVLLDELDSYVPCDWWLHVGGARAKSQQPQAPSLLVAQNTVTFERPDNVALDAFFLEPRQAQPKTGQVITTNGTTRHVAVADNGTTCFRAVLYPRYRTESRPTAELIAPGIIEVDRPGGWDLVVLDQAQRRYENRLRGVSIEGSVAVVRRNGSQWSAVLIAGRTIRLPGLRISAQAQISVARDRWGAMAFEVVEHSAPVIVLLEGQWLRRKRLRVEGQTPRPVVGSSAEVNLPAGLNRFAIE